MLHSHSPVGNVDVMRAPAGDHSCTELFAAQPTWPVVALFKVAGNLRVHSILRVVNQRSRAQPHFIIEIRGDRLFLLVSTGGVAGKANLDRLDLADVSVSN